MHERVFTSISFVSALISAERPLSLTRAAGIKYLIATVHHMIITWQSHGSHISTYP